MRPPSNCVPLVVAALTSAAVLLLTGMAVADLPPSVSAPGTVSGAEATLITFMVSASDPDGEPIASLTASGTAMTAGATFSVNATFTSGTFNWTPNFTQAGTWSATFTAANSSSSGSATTLIIVCNGCARAPVVTAPSNVSGVSNTLITFTVSAADPDADAITSLTAAPLPALATFTTNASFTSGTFRWEPTNAQTGNFYVTFTASNALSGSATTQITVFAGGDRAPVVNAPANISGVRNTLNTFTVTAADPDGEAISSLTAAPLPTGATFTTNATFTSGTFNWTPTDAQAGTYNVTFTASNALSGSATTQIWVQGIAGPPIVTAPAAVSGVEGTLMNFTVTASDPDGDPITTLTGSGSAMAAGGTFTSNAAHTSGTFNWTPNFTRSGSYSVTFTASNALSGSATTVITVENLDRPPVVTAPAMVQGAHNVLITFTASATDPDGDPISSFTASGPAIDAGGKFTTNASNTSGTFNWTPTNSNTTTVSVTFTASNALSGSATTLVRPCECGDRAPVVTAPATMTVVVDTPLTFTVSATDPDGDAIGTLSAAPLPTGATFTVNAAHTSGTFSWTPTSSQAGVFNVVFTASNAFSGSARTQITVGGGSALAARAFTLGSNKAIRLNSGKPWWCAFVEPVGGSFQIMSIDLASVRLRSSGTGTVSEIPAEISKSVIVGDADKNQTEDVELCFAKDDLRALFGGLHGKSTVPVSITGSLITGGAFEATLSVDVIAGGGSLAAAISPNPLNPTGTISFSTPTAGLARVHIFDASGRLVRTLAEVSLAAGRHDLPLDVRDGAGRRPSSGVYFYRVEIAGEVATGRFVVTR